jgi:hypothetical protein
MKKIIISALMLIIITGTAFSRDKDVISNEVLSSFNKTFNNAKEVKWEAQKDFVKVTFVIDGQTMFAYYNANGEQMALTRNIPTSQLPINLGSSLRERFTESWLTSLFEFSGEGTTVYYATIQDATHITVLKSDGTSNWIVYKKDKRGGQ